MSNYSGVPLISIIFHYPLYILGTCWPARMDGTQLWYLGYLRQQIRPRFASTVKCCLILINEVLIDQYLVNILIMGMITRDCYLVIPVQAESA